MDIELISTDLIDDNPYQVRRRYSGVLDLANDILSWKLALPETLGLQHVPAGRDINGRVQLVYGHRRLRAFRFLAATHSAFNFMPVRLVDFSDAQMLDGVWTENNNRKDFCDVERAELMQAKYEQVGTHAAVAAAWGLDRSTVTNLLRLLALPDEVQEANRDGRLTGRMIAAVAQLYRAHPDSPVIGNVLVHPEQYTSDSIRQAVRRDGHARHDGRPPQPVVFGAPSLRLSAVELPMPEIGRAATFACRQCQETAPVTEAICEECPLTTFLRRLHTETR